MIETLTREESERFLARQVVGRVGCHADGRTYVVPVIYVWDGECVWVQSMEGRKIEMMRANPSVCFEVDEYEAGGGWRSVIVEGAYEELEADAAADALALLVQRFAGARRQRGERSSGRRPVAFRIRAESISGRRVVRAARPRLARLFLRRRVRKDRSRAVVPM